MTVLPPTPRVVVYPDADTLAAGTAARLVTRITDVQSVTSPVHVVLTGGTLRPLQHSLVNPGVADSLAGVHVDLAIIGATGIDDDGRVTNVNLPEAEVKRQMIAAATRRVLVADSSKIGRRHLGLVGE